MYTKKPWKNQGYQQRHLSADNQSQPSTAGNNKDYEDRRNAAACFANPNKTENWHADFTGLLVTEELSAGTKCWVNIYERTDRKGRKYLSVVLKPQEGGQR
jgi:hypothetical protein